MSDVREQPQACPIIARLHDWCDTDGGRVRVIDGDLFESVAPDVLAARLRLVVSRAIELAIEALDRTGVRHGLAPLGDHDYIDIFPGIHSVAEGAAEAAAMAEMVSDEPGFIPPSDDYIARRVTAAKVTASARDAVDYADGATSISAYTAAANAVANAVAAYYGDNVIHYATNSRELQDLIRGCYAVGRSTEHASDGDAVGQHGDGVISSCDYNCRGWDIFETNRTPRLQIQRCDECDRYIDDNAARVAFVLALFSDDKETSLSTLDRVSATIHANR